MVLIFGETSNVHYKSFKYEGGAWKINLRGDYSLYQAGHDTTV